MVIPVQINSYQNPIKFLLDTGDEKTVVDKRLTQKLGLPADGEATVLKTEAEASAALVHVRELRVGSLVLQNQNVISYDLSGFSQALGLHVDGILGLDMLEKMRLKIDYSNSTITLSSPANRTKDTDGVAVQLIRDGPSVLVPVTINDSIQELLFLDTGSNYTNLSWHAWQRVTANWHPIEIVSGLRTSSEPKGTSLLTRLDSIQVGEMKVSRPAVVVTAPSAAGTMAQRTTAGLLGQNVLRRFILTIDLHDNRMFLSPDPKFHPDPLRYSTIGIQIQRRGMALLVASVWDDSPASGAGIKTGDELLRIDGKAIDPTALGVESGHLVNRPEGTTIRLLLRRQGQTFERSIVCRNFLP
jgi:predicted aspartyl protease